MVLLDNLFSKKPGGKSSASQDAGPTNLSADEEQALDRKGQRLERRELLYAVVRESMARVGVLSTSYKYKVLSLDPRGSQYLIMMDLPKEMADHIDQLAEIEEVITQTARTRHKIDVTAVYWRINELAKVSVLRKPRPEPEVAPRPAAAEFHLPDAGRAQPTVPGRNQRFEPIRADEVHAFKQALANGVKPKPASNPARGKPSDFAPTEFPPTEFEATRLNEEELERVPLSRTQYGDLI
jgi:hypothetical protein